MKKRLTPRRFIDAVYTSSVKSRTKVYHSVNCHYATLIATNRKRDYHSWSEAENDGLLLCRLCGR